MGNGTVEITASGLTRAQWDVLVAAVTNFKSQHPEIVSVNFQYHETTTQ